MGKGAALADHLCTFVALVDFGGEGQPGVWVIPSTTMRQHFATLEEPKPYRCRTSAEELTHYEEDWDAVEDYLLGVCPHQTGWFDREEIEERYGEEFVEALDAEASRLLEAQGMTVRRMADERFPAEELAEAPALLRVLFSRWMASERELREKGSGRA